MSSDRVIVVKADDVRAVLAEYEPLMEARGQRGEAAEIDRLRAALDTDREKLLRRIALTIHAGVTGQRPDVGGPEDLADAILAVIEEGADR